MPASPAEAFTEAGMALLHAATFALLFRRLPRRVAAPLVAAFVAAAALIPVGGLTPLQYWLSLTGPLSAATWLLAGRSLVRDFRRPPAFEDRAGFRALAATVLALGLLLYPGAMGLLPLDPYRLGFLGPALPLGLLALLALAYALRAPAIAGWLGLAGAAFLLRLAPSRNLWDYVVDPVACLLAAILLAEALLARRRRQTESAAPTAAAGALPR